MPRAILTGGPGAGKTTLLLALGQTGISVYEESAREVIRERREQGLGPRPSPLEFSAEIARRDFEKYKLAEGRKDWSVYDRGAVEAIGGVHSIAPMESQALRELLGEYKVEKVFLLPPWPEIYATDEERDQTAEEAGRVYHLVRSWYVSVGYSPIEVPRATVSQRTQVVLHALGAA